MKSTKPGGLKALLVALALAVRPGRDFSPSGVF
jgi:hypothetical protein